VSITSVANPAYRSPYLSEVRDVFELDTNGLDLAAGAIGTDITGLVKALIETAPDTVMLVDPDGSVVYVNHRITDILGYAPRDLMGMSVDALMPAGLRKAHANHRKRFQMAAETRPMGNNLDLHALHQHGHEVPVEISLSPLPATDGKIWVIAVVRDVTERKALEDRSRTTHARLLVANDRERIARDLHDSVIQRLFACGLTLQAVSAIIEQPMARRIESTIDELDDTIADLRQAIFDLQRHREGEPSSVRIRNTIEASLQSSSASLTALKGTDLLEGLAESLVSDIDSVIRELLTNAIRHANPRRVAVIIDDSEGLSIEVRDDGPGFTFEGPEGNGIPNLRSRAARHGGQFTVSRDITNLWTIARWQIPEKSQ
tara:strand:- start:622 stop:1743 length:1122 start_codon:yes stop_codon:yes gene_type:complete